VLTAGKKTFQTVAYYAAYSLLITQLFPKCNKTWGPSQK